MPKIKVALIGIGNCASAVVQGLSYYKDAKEEKETGLRHLFLGGYHPRDIELVSAFDIDARKVKRDLAEAIFPSPNNTPKFAAPPKLNVPVMKGPVLDGVGEYLKKVVQIDESKEVNVAKKLRESNAEIVINLLPSGALEASQWYAREAIKVGCAFINVTPVAIASDSAWCKLFEEAGLVVVGDDLVDQIGATILHKTLLKTLSNRGVRISETYQLDVGGGTESLNTLERTRDTKRTVKTKTIEDALPYKASVIAGSTDYVDFLENRRDSYFWVKGQYFGGAPMQLDIRLNTIDAPNAGSVIIDVIRAVKVAIDRGLVGSPPTISAYAFKNPLQPLPPEEAEQRFIDFFRGKRIQ